MKMMEELIVDNFAGGGGASTGIELAVGRPVDIAINHDPDAIAMHRVNHPNTRHYCESVWDVNPAEICGGRPVGLMWLSPDCKHFSRAKGGKPVSKNVRGLAWIAVRWAATVKPRVIILENVPEFVTWGRLDKDGKPDKNYVGETFRSFVRALKRHGYEVKWGELKACEVYRRNIREGGEYTPLPIKAIAVEEFSRIWEAHGIGWFCDVIDDSKLPGYKLVFAYHGSSTYDTKQMSKLIDRVKADAESVGIVPLPSEQIAAMIDEWEKMHKE